MPPVVLEWLRVVLAALALGVVASLVVDAWGDAPAAANGNRVVSALAPSREEVDSVLTLLGDGHTSLVLVDASTSDQVAALLGQHATLTLASIHVESYVDSEPVIRLVVDVETERGDFPVHLDLVHHDRWLVRSVVLGLSDATRPETLLA